MTAETTPSRDSMDTRRDHLAHIQATPAVDVLIVGGGIIGTGLFRDLALQGVNTLLVDRSDFGVGASAGPSRMIHGGLRYLEYGEFRLVKESVTERNRLLRNAPHYVFPLPTTIPIGSRFTGLGHILAKCLGIRTKRPLRRGSTVVKLGLALYDWFSRPTRVMPKHSFASKSAALARRPALTPDIACTATYYDAWISYPERLCMELALDAEAACSDARALSYCSLHEGSDDTAVLRDELSGELVSVKPRIVVNATGAWIDRTNKCLGLDTSLIGGTKGGHCILENPALAEALGDEMVFYETPEGRVCIAFVWQGKPLIGSTDLRIENPDDAVCDDEEIDYILKAIRTPFPDIEVSRDQVLSTFSGVRPLGSSRAAVTGQVSRSHRCEAIAPSASLQYPVYSMIGGKWTPFRVFAEHVAARIARALGTSRRTDTTDLPIGGGMGFPADDSAKSAWLTRVADRTRLPRDRVADLLWRYGTRAEAVAVFLAEAPDKPLTHHSGYTQREIEFMCRHECVCRLDDIVLRRTAIALLGELTPELLTELATAAGAALGWSEDDVKAEVARTRDILRAKNGIDLT